MREDKMLWSIRILINNINLLTVVFISVVSSYTVRKIVEGREARIFIEKVNCFPGAPDRKAMLALGALFLLIVLISFRKGRADRLYADLLYAGAETALCMCILYAIDFNYNGIILLVIADLMVKWHNCRAKAFWIAMLVLGYVMTGFDVVSGHANVIPFSILLTYYNAGTRAILAGLDSILESCNNIFFLLYMVMLIRIQGMENERIRILNERLDQANSQLRKANVQLKEYAGRMAEAARTMERNRLAREIHDTLGHALTGIIAGLDACMTLVEIAPGSAVRQLKKVQDAARQGMRDVRCSVNALRPDRLSRFRLQEALGQMIQEMMEMTHVKILLDDSGQKLSFDEDEEETIYRIVQESITNAIRHGNADKVEIRMRKEAGILHIRVQDDGTGCETVTPGFGLLHMEERVALLGGKIFYDGTQGFLLVVELPVRWGKDF